MTGKELGSQPILSVRNLRKSFRGRRGKGRPGIVEAVRGIDLTVAEGEIFGFLGPNGAGKSTTLRILSTLLAPDAGEVTIAGFDVQSEPREVRRQIGYVSQAGGADPLSTGQGEPSPAGTAVRAGPGTGRPARRRADPGARARRFHRAFREKLLRWPETEARHRHRDGPEPENAFSR